MSVRKYCVAPLPERRVHGRAAPALKHLTVAHQTLEGIFDSFHVVRTATGASDKDGRGRLKEAEVDLLRSALVLAGAGLDAVLKRLARDALPELLAVGATHAEAGKAFRAHVSTQVRDNAVDLVDQGDTRRGSASSDDPPICRRAHTGKSPEREGSAGDTRCSRRQ